MQDPQHLYMIFDLMPGGDLMDVLVRDHGRVCVCVGGERVTCLETDWLAGWAGWLTT